MIGKHIVVGLAALVTASTVSWPAPAFTGCSDFRGGVDDQTKGPGGNRVGAGFSKGDTLAVTIHQAANQRKITANLLEYASPEGPFRALTHDASESFIYTVPANTRDFIYLNISSALPGMFVAWSCTPQKER